MSGADAVDVVDTGEQFEARTGDGSVVGFAVYERRDGAVVFLHTEVDDAVEGRGVGSSLVSGSLDQVRAAGERVVALCPFVAAYLERHPEYADLTER